MNLVFKDVKLVVKDAEDVVALGEHPLSQVNLAKLNEIISDRLFGRERGMEMMEDFATELYQELCEPQGKMDNIILQLDVTWDVEYVTTE